MQSTSGLGKRKLETSQSFQPPKRIKTNDTIISLSSNLTRAFIESYCSKETSLQDSQSLLSRINNAILYEDENECRLQASIWDETHSKLTNTKIRFSGKSQITNVSCDCLFNKQSWCVHIVATLLLIHENPTKIIIYEELKAQVSKLSREQLELLILTNLEDGAFLNKLQHTIKSGMVEQVDSLSETIDTKSFVSKIDTALNICEDVLIDDYCDCDEYEEFGECDCFYKMELDIEKIIEQMMASVVQMWQKKNYANALKVMTDITRTVLNKRGGHAKDRCIRLIDKEWRKLCLLEEFPEQLREVYKPLLKEWSEKLKSDSYRNDAFSAAAQLLEVGWDHPDLKKILAGEDYEKTKLKEKLSTVIERLQYLHLHGRTKEGYYLGNYITRREIQRNDEMSLWNLANAVKLDYPVGAIILLSKIMWLKIRGVGILTTSNIGQDQAVTTMFELVCQNKKREVTDKCPPLQKLAAIALANALEKFYENNWDNCTEILLNLPEGVVQALGVHMAAMLYRKYCENGHYYDSKHYRKLIELGEEEAAFEIGLSGLRQTNYGDFYTYSYDLEQNRAVSLLNLACKLGKSYVYRLINKVKSNAHSSTGDFLLEFAKELELKGSFKEELVDLLMTMIPLRWRRVDKKRSAVNMLVDLSMAMGVPKLQAALEVIFRNIQDFVILLEILRQLKSNHKNLAKKFSFICCAKVKDEAPKLSKLPSTCTCDVCMRNNRAELMTRPTKDVQEKAVYNELPELMIQLHLKNGKLPRAALKKLKEAMNTTQLVASFAMALKDIDPKESMELALQAASSEGKVNRKELADTFCPIAKEQGNLEYAQKLAMSVAQFEPSAESFERLRSLVSVATFEKLKQQLLPKQFSNLPPKLVEVLLSDNQFVSLQNIINGTRAKKLLACMDIVNKCTEKGVPAEDCEANFWEHVTKSAREHWSECGLTSFTIPFPRTSIDEWLFTLLNSTKGYSALALQLYKLRTEIFAEKISSTRPKSYEAFVEWLRQVKSAFEKCGVEKEWSEYLEKITQINTVKCKPKLMGLIRKDIVLNSKEELKA